MIDGCSWPWRTLVRTRSFATRTRSLAARGPGAGRVGRPDALPDHDPGGVEALEQPGVDRVLGARRVGVDRLEVADDAVLVDRAQRVAAPEDVLVDRGAAQADRLAVEQQVGAVGAHLAQADARAVGRLARDLERRGPTGSARSATTASGSSIAHLRLQDLGAALGERLGREVEARSRRSPRVSVPFDAERARVDVVAQVDLEVDARAAPSTSFVLQLRVADLARADAADAHPAVDAAEVEPQPVPAVALHRVRAAPVGAHDELVARAGRQAARAPRTAGTRPCARPRACRRRRRARGG